MSKSILGFLLTLFLVAQSRAEQPIFNISSIDANPGEIVNIDFHVNNFTDIISVQYSVNWNPAVLEFRAVKNFNASVPGLSASVFGTNQALLDQGKLTLSWIESSISPITLPDGSRFYTIEFEVVGDPCDNSTVAITDNPLEIEVAEEGEVSVGLVSNTGQVSVPGSGCVEGINIIGNSVIGTCGSTTCIQFTVENFISVGAMEFSLIYDPAVLEFDRFQNYAPLLTFGDGNTNLLFPGALRVVWFNGNAENDTLPDGTVLFEVCFDVIGSGGQSSQITFGNNPSVMISDIDGNFHTVNITPAVITAQCAIEGFALIADTVCTEPGEIACVNVSVNDFEDIVALQFSMNWDPTLFEFDHVECLGLPGLNSDGFGMPGNPDVQEGELTLSWIDLTLNGVTLPDLSTIFCVCLRAIGPAGSSSIFTFSDNPLEIEIANSQDSILVPALIQGLAQIRVNCEDSCALSYTIIPESPDCPGEANGSLDVSLDIGSCNCTPQYIWSFGNVTTQDLLNVPAGTYTVTITCGTQIVVASGTVTNPISIGVSGTVNHPNPIGTATGSINIEVTGGTPGYTFMWNTTPPSTSEDLNNLLPGTYTVTVTDSEGCTFVSSFVVGGDLAAQITHISCAGICNGSISLTSAFGTAPYAYLWSHGPTTPTINGLCAGTYCVTVTDNIGATRDSCFVVNLQSGTPLNVTATIIHDVNENCQGAIDLNVTGSLMPYTFQWSNPPGSTNSDIINLCEGEYCVTITHNAVCTFDTCFTVFSGDIGVALNASNPSCNGVCDGQITAVVSGGVAPFTYLWSNNETTQTISNLCAGIYGLTVTDATGNSTVGTRTLTSPPPLVLNFIETDPTDFTTNDGAISVIVNGGTPFYTFQWTGTVSDSTASLNNLPAGTYNIRVTDANGCQATSNRTLVPVGTKCFIGNKLITPNDDGFNDYFILTCIDNLDNHLYIFNRNGGLVYDAENYTNNWNGVDEDNEPVADGGYLWVLEYTDLNGINQVLKGAVNVLRTAD